MKKFRFRKFQVYQDSLCFQKEIKELARKKFPKIEEFSLTIQLCRALDSIVLNIAEGTDRGADKDFAHFSNMPHTSLNEVVACLDLAKIQNYISEQDYKICLDKSEVLADQLTTAFRKKLLSSTVK